MAWPAPGGTLPPGEGSTDVGGIQLPGATAGGFARNELVNDTRPAGAASTATLSAREFSGDTVRTGGTMVRREPPELVALKRSLDRQLAARREAAEIGQQQLARKTGYSRSSVAHAEAGRQLLTREFWKTADELLQADGALLADYEQVLAAKQEHERRSREAELAQAYAEARAGHRRHRQPQPRAPGGKAIRVRHRVAALRGHL